ncbi:unnamed protein product [Toxocara canis]|uniref:Glycoprotein-N-acetylgalactosamine 3-beta-galactosyltransferase 1 n=1 Tax=Toxocara canis TaxID=6265 RepID=A0A183TWL6_TOXCA|nr:unnamed protein product [Toxocara canis]
MTHCVTISSGLGCEATMGPYPCDITIPACTVSLFTDNNTAAGHISMMVRILCLITTTKQNHISKARHVAATWAKRCTKYIFVSSESDPSLPSIHFDIPEGRDHLWSKTKAAFKYAYDHYPKDIDWFMKADDDTYVILENLRLFLLTQRADDPIYVGCRFKREVKNGYMSGGAGYVLSRGALTAFVERALPNSSLCSADDTVNEDVEMGKCLENVGVRIQSSIDSAGRHRYAAYYFS